MQFFDFENNCNNLIVQWTIAEAIIACAVETIVVVGGGGVSRKT